MIDNDDEFGAVCEIKIAGETKILGENLPQSHFFTINST
jgi:hypothetical protein